MTEPAPGHEFETQHNDTIARLSGAMLFVAVFQAILSALFGAFAILHFLRHMYASAIGNGFVCIVNVLLAAALFSAASSFRSIVFSSGKDIPHLMSALEQLRRYYLVRKIVILIMLGLILTGLVLAILLLGRAGAGK